MLTAMQCEKADVDGNLAAHRGLLEEASRQHCDLVVFPEFSLTGSVNAVAHPERAVEITDERIGELVRLTSELGVGAVFGLGERAAGESAGRLHITQVVAVGGAVVAVQRKRHIADDEAGFEADVKTATFDLEGQRLGIVICAESTVDFTWQATVEAGADVVVFCSAPGLYGRRTADADWQSGFAWWESAGLADARHQAAKHGVWVAMATQAGSTIDEDFPGIAALIDPHGEIVSRLPDGRSGCLIVEIPHAQRDGSLSFDQP